MPIAVDPKFCEKEFLGWVSFNVRQCADRPFLIVEAAV